MSIAVEFYLHSMYLADAKEIRILGSAWRKFLTTPCNFLNQRQIYVLNILFRSLNKVSLVMYLTFRLN